MEHFPIFFEDSILGREKSMLYVMKNRVRICLLEALNECIEEALMELKSQHFEKFLCKTKDGTQPEFHSMASNATDIPETEDPLGVERGKTA